MDPFTSLIQILNQMGFYGFLLPWIFVFAVVYGLLVASKVFGESSSRTARGVSGAIAFVVAFFVTLAGGPTIAAFFTNIFGGATLIIAGILVIVLFLTMGGLFGEQASKEGKGGGKAAAAAIIIVIGIVLFLVASGVSLGLPAGIVLSEQAAAAIFVIIVIVLAMWLITRPEKEKGP